jgi:hypothetical protein
VVSLTEELFREGTISTLLGLPGAGKTNVATFLMQNAVKHGFHIYTNIHFFDFETIPKAIEMKRLPKLEGKGYERKPEQIYTITTISDLLLGCLTTPKNATVIDEGGFFATSSSATSKKVRQMKELSYIIRHLNSSLLIIAQSKGSIVPDLRKTLVKYQLDIEKKSSKWRELSIKTTTPVFVDGEQDIEFSEIDRIGGVPMASIPWDGYFLPKFKFDIDLSAAFDALGEYNSVEVLEHGPNIIRKLKKGKKGKTSKEEEKERVYDEARDLFEELKTSGLFKKKQDLVAHIAVTYKKAYPWAFNLCRDLSFDD